MGSEVNNHPVNRARFSSRAVTAPAGRGGDTVKEFARKVREQLKARKVSQAELAEAIGTSQQVVSRWLESNTPPKSTYLLRLARYFDLPVDYLIDDAQGEPPPSHAVLSEDERIVLAVVRGLRDLGVAPDEILKRLLQQSPPVIRWGKPEEATPGGRPESVELEHIKPPQP